MPRQSHLTPAFVEFIPEVVEEGVLYVSMEYATATHKCACGCGLSVVTPFSPTDWRLSFDGRSVTLHPSIGNWSFPCSSHYYVRNNRIQWVGRMSNADIELGRRRDRAAKNAYFNPSVLKTSDLSTGTMSLEAAKESATVTKAESVGLLKRLKRMLSS